MMRTDPQKAFTIRGNVHHRIIVNRKIKACLTRKPGITKNRKHASESNINIIYTYITTFNNIHKIILHVYCIIKPKVIDLF